MTFLRACIRWLRRRLAACLRRRDARRGRFGRFLSPELTDDAAEVLANFGIRSILRASGFKPVLSEAFGVELFERMGDERRYLIEPLAPPLTSMGETVRLSVIDNRPGFRHALTLEQETPLRSALIRTIEHAVADAVEPKRAA